MMSSSFFFQRKPFGLFNGPQNDKTFLLLRKSVNLTTFSSLFSTLLLPSARHCGQAAAAVLDLGLRRHLASIQARISLKDRYNRAVGRSESSEVKGWVGRDIEKQIK